MAETCLQQYLLEERIDPIKDLHREMTYSQRLPRNADPRARPAPDHSWDKLNKRIVNEDECRESSLDEDDMLETDRCSGSDRYYTTLSRGKVTPSDQQRRCQTKAMIQHYPSHTVLESYQSQSKLQSQR